MAGTYPSIPGNRFALDQDGTIVKWRNFTTLGLWTDISTSIVQTQLLTTSSSVDMQTGSENNYVQVSLAFPEVRAIDGIYAHFGFVSVSSSATNFTWESSADTTDGTDGTWAAFTLAFTALGSHINKSQSSKPYYRSDIAPLTLVTIKGIRVRWNSTSYNYGTPHSMFVLQVYGSRPTAGVDRLAFWHPTLDQAIAPAALDFGDIPQGNSGTRQVRIKNLSATLTANAITVAVSDLLPEYTGSDMQLSADNVTYAASISIGNLAASIISPILYVRRSVPGAEATGLRTARLIASATSWA